MRLKVFRLFFLSLLIGVAFNNLPSKALTPTDPTSEKYLIEHGHSKEIVRMINLQKDRIEGKVLTAPVSENKFKKFFKNIWFYQDVTMPITDFGYSEIKSPETEKELFSKDLTEPIKDFVKKNKKDVKSNEINVNDVKVRESE